MRRGVAFIVLLLSPLSGGCAGLFHIGTRNLLYEAHLEKDSLIEQHYFRHLAQQAWAENQQNCPGKHFAPDYECGFKDGFVDYLYAGGNGEPPALLPKRYLRYHEQRNRGCQGLMDWYTGFRHGAAVAHDSGLRKSFVIALPPSPAPPPPLPGAFHPVATPVENTPLPEPADLPMPKKDAPATTQPTAERSSSASTEKEGPDFSRADPEEEPVARSRSDEPIPEKQP
jgi:hypothetical protein